jgi:dipeptidyl aminopeptidase/acylaminoacyl peptidase
MRSDAAFPRIGRIRKKVSQRGHRRVGRKVQNDVTWGVNYLVAEGITDPKRVAIMGGGSCGGYSAIAGITLTCTRSARRWTCPAIRT